jgi:hypothetical protein
VGQQPTETEQSAYEQEYKKNTSPGGFEKSANFVSLFLVDQKYDDFVAAFIKESKPSDLIRLGFPPFEGQAKSDHIHTSLFARRNRIMHWGEMGYDKQGASEGLAAASTAISVLKTMDHRKNIAREKAWRLSMNSQS